MGVPPIPPRPGPGSEDSRFGETLVREGVLSAEQIQTAVHAQQSLRAQGVRMRLGEILVQHKLLTPDQVRQFIALAGKQILHCPRCSRNFNVKNWSPGREVLCPTCSVALVSPQSGSTLDASDTQHLPPAREPADARDRTGTVFGRYRLLDELGRGGMGIVWKAWDTELKRVVALKQILPTRESEAAQVERFMREARLAAKLRHPHIVPVHDVGVHAGRHYFTTDYIAGQPLDRVMKKPVSTKQALGWIKAAAEALAYAHQQGVVHRDIKPANILIDGHESPYVMDFGLAKDVELGPEPDGTPGLTRIGALLGTPQYMSPEQAAGHPERVGPLSDQFSLGAVMYELLTRRPAFAGTRLREILNAVAEKDPPRPAAVHRRLHRDVETICLRALEKDPRRRYPTMGDFAEDLGRYLEGEPIVARPSSGPARLWRKAVKNGRVVFPVAAAVLAAAGFGAWAIASSHRSENVAARSTAHDEALRMLETARPALDQAVRALYTADAPPEEIVRQVDKAQPVIERAIARAPDLALGHHLLGVVWSLRGWEDKAEACWRKAIAVDVQFGPAHFHLGRLLLERAFMESLSSSHVLDLSPKAPKPEGEIMASEAAAEIELATKIGLDAPAQRAAAAGMLEFLRGHREEALRTARAGIASLGKTEGVEELHWLESVAVPRGPERMEAYRRALAIRPKYPLVLLFRGTERAAALDFQGAVVDLTEALRLRPRFAEALSARAAMKAALRDFKGAIEDCTAALEADPGNLDARVNRGLAHRWSGDTPQAIEDFTQALTREPLNPDTYFLRATCHTDTGDWPAVVADCGEALKLDPRHVASLVERSGALWELGDAGRATADIGKALSINPDHPQALQRRGVLRYLQGDVQGSRADLERALTLMPELAIARVHRSILRRFAGDLDGAVADCTQALKDEPLLPEAYANRAMARILQRDPAGAIADLNEALKLRPGYFEAMFERAEARLVGKDPAGALADYTAALKMRPGHPMSLFHRGQARQFQGDKDGAAADFAEALKAAPMNWDRRAEVEAALRSVYAKPPSQ